MDFAWIPRIHLLLGPGVLVALINTLNTQGRGSKSAGDRQESHPRVIRDEHLCLQLGTVSLRVEVQAQTPTVSEQDADPGATLPRRRPDCRQSGRGYLLERILKERSCDADTSATEDETVVWSGSEVCC